MIKSANFGVNVNCKYFDKIVKDKLPLMIPPLQSEVYDLFMSERKDINCLKSTIMISRGGYFH